MVRPFTMSIYLPTNNPCSFTSSPYSSSLWTACPRKYASLVTMPRIRFITSGSLHFPMIPSTLLGALRFIPSINDMVHIYDHIVDMAPYYLTMVPQDPLSQDYSTHIPLSSQFLRYQKFPSILKMSVISSGSSSSSASISSLSSEGQYAVLVIQNTLYCLEEQICCLDCRDQYAVLSGKVDTSYPTGGYGVSVDLSEQNT
ncbi:hypothetical protein Tco_0917577 [Tanacetum coccineum]